MTNDRLQTPPELLGQIAKIVDEFIAMKFHLVTDAMDHAVFNNVPGDYLEFGVRGGTSFLLAWRSYMAMHEQLHGNQEMTDDDRARIPEPMRFFAFDAFDTGLPTPAGLDDTEIRSAHWSAHSMKFPVEHFFQHCLRSGMPEDQLFVIPGYFEQTLGEASSTHHGIHDAAVVHLDCDLYESTRDALVFMTDLMQLGTILIFDDFFRYRGSELHGQYYAFKEWQERNPHLSFRELSRFRGAVSFICSKVTAHVD